MDGNLNPQLTEISMKLDKVTKLLALNLVKDLKTQREQIALLSDAGFQPKEIASILSTSSNNVRVALHSIRKERGPSVTEETEQGDKEKTESKEKVT
jgi:DNA-directed RNA polymerase specialized sigma24 family protein